MNLTDIVERTSPPVPWSEGEKIPWHDSSFSSRMLKEHLSQDHNAASRRSELIDQHVNWLHTQVLSGQLDKILDLCCGPGLYTKRLAALGHSCVGIDYAPASIDYARRQNAVDRLSCEYIESDVRNAPFGYGYGLVFMVHGELNVFRPEEIHMLLDKSSHALKDGGQLVLEVHTLEAVELIGRQDPEWYTTERGLFSDTPHLMLKEGHWDADQKIASERFFVMDAQSGEVTRYAASIQGFSEKEYWSILKRSGFTEIQTQPSLGGQDGEPDKNYRVYRAKKG